MSPFSIGGGDLHLTCRRRNAAESKVSWPCASRNVGGHFSRACPPVLRSHWQDAGLDQNFQINADDQLRMVRRVWLRSMLMRKVAAAPVGLVDKRAKDEGLGEHIHDQGDLFVQVQLRIYGAYQRRVSAAG